MVTHLHKKINKYQILFYFLSHIPMIIFKYLCSITIIVLFLLFNILSIENSNIYKYLVPT